MIVVDVLSVYSCLKILLKHPKCRRVYFIMQSHGLLDRVSSYVMRMLGWKFTALEYDLTPNKGDKPYLHVRKKIEDVFNDLMRPKIRVQVYGQDYFTKYEKQRISTCLEVINKRDIYRSIEILYLLETDKVGIGKPDVVLLSNVRWHSEIAALYKEKGISVSFYRIWVMRELKRRDKYSMDYYFKTSISLRPNRLFGSFYLLNRIVLDICTCLFYRIARLLSKRIPPKLQKFDLAMVFDGYTKSEWLNELFWKREEAASKVKTLAMYFGAYSNFDFKAVENLADGWVGLSKFSYSPSIKPIYYWLWPEYPKLLIKKLSKILIGAIRSKIPLSNFFEIINLWIEVSKMEALFKITGIKIFWTSVEGMNLVSLAGSLAMNRAGGVTVGSTWSLYGHRVDFRGYRNALDVWFIWGKQHADFLQEDLFKSMVVCGYSGDFYMEEHLRKGINLRGQLKQQKKVESIICYYDNAVGNDIHHSSVPVTKYFSNVLNWLKDHPGNLLVLKSKSKRVLDNYPDDIKKLFRELESQNRIVYELKKGDLSPGFAADLILGFKVTMPCLLGAYGKKAILLDVNEFNKKNPLDLENVNFINDPEEIIERLEKWSLNGKDDDIRMTPTPSKVDPFVDGCSFQRVSGYILNLLDGLNRGMGADEAIDTANSVYAKECGSETIIPKEKVLV